MKSVKLNFIQNGRIETIRSAATVILTAAGELFSSSNPHRSNSGHLPVRNSHSTRSMISKDRREERCMSHATLGVLMLSKEPQLCFLTVAGSAKGLHKVLRKKPAFGQWRNGTDAPHRLQEHSTWLEGDRPDHEFK